MLMPYGQKRREIRISIDIYALRAKEIKKLNSFSIKQKYLFPDNPKNSLSICFVNAF